MIDLAPGHKRGLGLACPVMNAAGVLGFAGEWRGVLDLAGLGAFVTNACTATPRTPAAPPNAVPLAQGVVIHTGLPNPGVRAAVRRYAREWARLGPPVIVHLAATTPDDVRRSARLLEHAEAVSGLELGLRDELSAGEAAALVAAAQGGLPLVVRLPVAQAAALWRVAVRAGADALTVAAPPRRNVTVDGQTVTGRLYSPDTFADALAAVQQVMAEVAADMAAEVRETPVPVVGAGGIYTLEQARAMLAAGATAIQLDGVIWQTPERVAEIAAGVEWK